VSGSVARRSVGKKVRRRAPVSIIRFDCVSERLCADSTLTKEIRRRTYIQQTVHHSQQMLAACAFSSYGDQEVMAQLSQLHTGAPEKPAIIFVHGLGGDVIDT
jgi:hypothetical protein